MSAENIKLVTSSFKPLTDDELKRLADEVYDDSTDSEVLNDLRNVLNPDVLEYSTDNRKVPEYAKGFLDKPYLEGGKPVREKDLALYNAILSEDFSFIEIEGSVRGGKDVNGLLGASRKAMVMPDPIIIALGSSLEHVLRTVLMAGGFGFYYTIPHGKFIRESVNGAQRGVYKFLDSYGVEKQIIFYGNEKENDANKFQGFNGIGLVYVNEALNQAVNGLQQAMYRLGTAKSPLMISSQNPRGASADFYLKFEKNFLATDDDIRMMEFIQKNYRSAFEIVENRIKEDREKTRKMVIKEFLTSRGKSSVKLLNNQERIDLQKIMLNHNYEYNSKIRGISVQKFYPALKAGDYLYNKSMKKVMGFFRGYPNVNNVKNAYDFAYFHYTVDDNISLNEMQKQDFKNRFAKGTAVYEQNIMGKRRSTEGAVYTGFSEENIFRGDIKSFDWQGMMRIIVIDPGFNHPTGMTDWAVDLDKGEAWCLQERLIDFNEEYTERKSLDVIYDEFLLLLRRLNNRGIDHVFIDPSKPELINYFQTAGFPAYPANNQNWNTKRQEKEISEEITARELRGIPLVQTAFAKNKIHIHESCEKLIKQVESYSYEKSEDGKDKLQDLGDDLVVTVKYLMNTSGIVPAMWLNEEGGGLSEEGRVLSDGDKEISVEDLARSFTEGLSRMAGFEQYSEDDFFGSEGFFGEEDDGFFN
jgi:hypothetical protein